MKKTVLIVINLLVATFVYAQEKGESSADGQWYASFLENRQVGFIHEFSQSRDKETYQYSGSKIALTRGTTKAEVIVDVNYLEDTKTGVLKSIQSSMKMSSQVTNNTFINGHDSISLIQEIGGNKYTKRLPAQGIAYGPNWIKENSQRLLKKAGDRFEFRTYSPDFGLYLSGTRKVIGLETLTEVEVLVIEEEFAEMPVKRKLWVDRNFDILKMADVTPFGVMESVLTDKEHASTDLSLVSLPAVFFDRVMAKSNIRLADARSIHSITLMIERRKGSTIQIPDLSSDFQQVLERKEDYAIIKISVPKMTVRPVKRETLPAAALKEYLEPNALINSDDASIIKIARDVTAGLKNNYEKCLALEKWVTLNMTFDMGIVVAPAAEVCRDRKGTCASYTTLLAALFRAAGIPARYNMGFVYMGGIWGGHAWPDAYVDGQWIPFDAAVNGEGSADAARFSFGATSLKNGAGEFSVMPGGLLYGNVDVEIQSYEINGKTHLVADGEASYQVIDNVYVNKSLSLTIKKENGFEFTELNESWPNYTVASVVNASGNEKITVIQTMTKPGASQNEAVKVLLQKQVPDGKLNKATYSGTKVTTTESTKEAVAAIERGQDVWLIKVKSDKPAELLARAFKWIKL